MLSSKQENYEKILSDASDLARECKCTPASQNSLKDLSSKVNNFKVVIPVIGLFSAGKTSLINKFIGEDLFSVNVTPETTLATEIVYGKSNKLELYKSETQIEEKSLDYLGKIDAKEYLYQRVYLNKDVLKKYPEIVLVDMPGIDSGLETHNKAILNYVNRGNRFILIVDVEDGTIKETNLNFLREILSYGQSIDVLINKIDKKPDVEVNEIYNQIKNTISSRVNNDIFVGKTSAMSNNVQDFVRIIESVNFEDHLHEVLHQSIKSTITQAKKETELYLKNIDVNVSEIDRQIKEIEHDKKKFKDKIEFEKIEFSNKLSSTTVENIIQEVKNTLKMNSNQLATLLKSGNTEGLKISINELLRPVLVNSTEESVKNVLKDTFENLNISFKDLTAIDHVNSFNQNDLFSKLTSKEFNIMFKSLIGALGLATTIIAPWLEIILLFLPEILQLFGLGSGGGIMTYINKIENDLIPQVCAELRTKVKESLQTVKDEIFKNIENDFSDKLNSYSSILEKLMSEKNQNIQNTQSQIEKFRIFIDQWNAILNRLN